MRLLELLDFTVLLLGARKQRVDPLLLLFTTFRCSSTTVLSGQSCSPGGT